MSNENNIKKRNGYFTNIHSFSEKLLTPILKTHGARYYKLIADWDKIVGSEFANKTMPLKISKSRQKGKTIEVLHIIANDSSIALMINYQKEIILEKISFYFGKNVIDDIRIIQNNFLTDQEDFIPKNNNRNIEIKDIKDKELSKTLSELGNFIYE